MSYSTDDCTMANMQATVAAIMHHILLQLIADVPEGC